LANKLPKVNKLTLNKLIFATLLADEVDQQKALILAESIRTYAGDLSGAPIWNFFPDTYEHFQDRSLEQFKSLNIDLYPFKVDSETANFPFAVKVVASAAAETLADGATALLAWMDPGSMVINEPGELLLEADRQLGCRPVDHLLIGPAFDKPLDPFWEFIFEDCGVQQQALFPMTTSTEQIEMFPYINAGMLIVRPKYMLLRTWRDTFLRVYLESRYQIFYQSNRLYQIFMHQAVLACCILSNLQHAEILELSHLVNYPLHMHDQYPIDRRPQFINELISFRYEDFFTDPNWHEVIQVKEPLKSWLQERQHLFKIA
jgi:hypothetical protein